MRSGTIESAKLTGVGCLRDRGCTEASYLGQASLADVGFNDIASSSHCYFD